jgi:predicted nuclease of predicted toxin-antitoxin system
MPKGEILAKAIAVGRTILTFDLDFAEIAALPRGKRASGRKFQELVHRKLLAIPQAYENVRARVR